MVTGEERRTLPRFFKPESEKRRGRPRLSAFLPATFAFPWRMSSDSPLCVVATGGTLDKIYFDALSAFSCGEPQGPVVLRAAGVDHPVSVVSVCKKDSLELTDADRQHILDAILARPERRILLTHGTDTMPVTAAFLKGRVGDKTVVLTGAMQPALMRETDAPFNLGFATAASALLAPGVYIAMNARVFEAGRVRKNREAGRFEAIA